jgi:transketolase
MSRTACLEGVYELAKKDPRVVFIGSDLSPNTLTKFREEMPDRFFMEGVQEQNIIGMAAGLAMRGFIPYVNTIATFLTRRCYEQVMVDIAMHNLPVRLIGNGGGLLYAPLGPTHCAIEDIAIMRAIPNMSVFVPSDPKEMKEIMPLTLEWPGPLYIRLGKDTDPPLLDTGVLNGRARILILSTGIMSRKAQDCAARLQIYGINVEVLHYAQVKPFRIEPILYMLGGYKCLVTMEEGIASGGFGSAVLESFYEHEIIMPVLRLGLPDEFPKHYGEQEDLLETYGLTPEKMAIKIKQFYASL